ncbi:MAG: hypothetical protein KA956_02595 [Pyrinomonadaceae bacterium]|nr:hypothetical protein [Pyrinomonadaceae bacterium]
MKFRSRILLLICVAIAFETTSLSAQDPEPRPTPRNVVIIGKPVPPKETIEKIELSELVFPNSQIGNTKFVNGELFMGSKRKGYYYVLAAPEGYITIGGKARVTLRNLQAARSSLGYGIVFHSDITPLQQGYAFVINTVTQKYRVVHHIPGDEKTLVPWKVSPFIKTGKAQNTLEIRDKGPVTELYINDNLVDSVKNTFAFKNGVVGLYSGDAVTIAFSDLTVTIVDPTKP